MVFRLAKRVADIPDYPFLAISAAVRQKQQTGEDVIRLDMGSPDMPPPPEIVKKLSEIAAQPNQHGYTGYRGLPNFREAVARYYKRLFDIDLNPETEVLPLLGSKEGLGNFILATINPGDVVICPNPAYPSYSVITQIAGAEPYYVPLLADNNFFPDFAAIPADIISRARALWLNYPNNPTGALATVEQYQQAFAFCKTNDIMLLSDNPYFGVIFDGGYSTSALQADPDKSCVIEFMSMSKSHNMAGWRLGAAVGNQDAIEALLRMKSNMDSGHFAAIYYAGAYALDETPQTWLDERNGIYGNRAKLLYDNLEAMGLIAESKPIGSLYIWARVPDGNDIRYAQNALENNVSLAAGSIYGDAGKGYVRMSLVQPEERIAEAIARLKC